MYMYMYMYIYIYIFIYLYMYGCMYITYNLQRKMGVRGNKIN